MPSMRELCYTYQYPCAYNNSIGMATKIPSESTPRALLSVSTCTSSTYVHTLPITMILESDESFQIAVRSFPPRFVPPARPTNPNHCSKVSRVSSTAYDTDSALGFYIHAKKSVGVSFCAGCLRAVEYCAQHRRCFVHSELHPHVKRKKKKQ